MSSYMDNSNKAVLQCGSISPVWENDLITIVHCNIIPTGNLFACVYLMPVFLNNP